MNNIVEFKNAVKMVSSCVNPAAIQPILKGVKIDKGFLYACNEQITIKVPLDVDGHSGVYEFDTLLQAVNALDNSDLSVIKTETALQLKTPKNKISVPYLGDINEWPKIDNHKTGIDIALTLKEVEKLVSLSAFTGKDELRPATMQVNFNGEEFAATEGSMLATFVFKENESKKISALIPPKVFNILSSFTAANCFIFRDSTVKILNNDIELGYLIYRTTDEVYPEYSLIIPDVFNSPAAEFSRAEMLNALNILTAGSDEKQSKGIFTINAGGGILATSFDEKRNRNAEAFIFSNNTGIGENVIIGLSIKKLVAALKYIGGNEITMYFSSPNKPVVIKSNDTKGLALIAPMFTGV